MEENLISVIKNRISCKEYLQRVHSITVDTNGRCKSFRPDAKNPTSLLVDELSWHDFGSGQGGDVIDLCANDKGISLGEAIHHLAKMCGMHPQEDINIQFDSYRDIMDEACTYYHEQLTPEVRAYLNMRGIKDETIDELRIGWATNPCPYLRKCGYKQDDISNSGITMFLNRIMFPYLVNGKAVYFVGRESVWDNKVSSHPGAKYIKLRRNDLSIHPIWGIETIHKRKGSVVVGEGIMDAISLYQEGYAVVSAITGTFSAEQKEKLFPMLKGRQVITVFDYDAVSKAGQGFTEKLANELFENGIRVSVVRLDGGDKKVDLNELYANGEPIAKILKTATPWEKVLLGRITRIEDEFARKEALEKFLRKCKEVLPWCEVMQLTSEANINGVFPEAWLSAVVKELKAPMSELDVVNMFLNKYDTVYSDALGFYEYKTKLWRSRSDTEIKEYLALCAGRSATSKLVNGAFSLLKGRVYRSELFNEHKDWINFPNCMFNIETGETRNHDRAFYSSIQLNYDYDPKAECPNWRSFVESITDDDPEKICTIREMIGYCLSSDVRYQVCFYLLGNGANGKSVLVNIMEALIGSANTSHVEISALASDFQRIKLISSKLNLCNDMQTDVSGSMSYFKALVAGDPTSACFKGRDFVDFKSSAKFVFSANKELSTRDIDYAFLRRIVMLNFPITFVDEPTDEHERKKDPTIYSKLLTELPGIFNWALDGLKTLRDRGMFAMSKEQSETLHELHAINDPLVGFIEEVISVKVEYKEKTLQRSEVYKDYIDWCNHTNSYVLSARSFWPRLRRLTKVKDVRNVFGRQVAFLKVFDKNF